MNKNMIFLDFPFSYFLLFFEDVSIVFFNLFFYFDYNENF